MTHICVVFSKTEMGGVLDLLTLHDKQNIRTLSVEIIICIRCETGQKDRIGFIHMSEARTNKVVLFDNVHILFIYSLLTTDIRHDTNEHFDSLFP